MTARCLSGGGRRPDAPTPRWRDARGFTLAELVIVMVLIGIIAISVTPLGSVISDVRLQSATERLASDIRYAQTLAMKEGGHIGVVVEPASARYSVMRNLATPVADPMNTRQDLGVSFGAESRFKGVSIVSASFGGGSTLQFDNLGAPRDAAYAALAATGQIVLGLGSKRDTVLVSAVTGRVSY